MGAAPRIACLHVSALPFAALLRADPALRGVPLAVVEGTSPRALVLHASPEAAGVLPGMTATQARAACGQLVLRSLAPALMRAALDALADLALAHAPIYERAAEGVFLPVGDLKRLFSSEQAIGTSLFARGEGLGLTVRVGLAAGTRLAAIAARKSPGVTVVPRGEERRFLSPLPIEALHPGEVIGAKLLAWGVHSVGDFAALPRPPLVLRLGGFGVQLHRLACGQDETPLRPTPPDPLLVEALDLEDPIDNLEPLAFVLRGLLDRLVARLALRGGACPDYTLRLDLSPRGQDEWPVQVAAPTRDTAVLLRLGRAALQALPPSAPVHRVTLLCRPAGLRPCQLDLFVPTGPAPERLAVTLSRLRSLCGEDGVGAPFVSDTHLPGEGRIRAFPAEATRERSAPRLAPARPILAPQLLRPAQPAEVIVLAGRPISLRADAATGDIARSGGPHRVRIGWGTTALRDYYDVELRQGGLFRLFQDLTTGDWFLDARYD